MTNRARIKTITINKHYAGKYNAATNLLRIKSSDKKELADKIYLSLILTAYKIIIFIKVYHNCKSRFNKISSYKQ